MATLAAQVATASNAGFQDKVCQAMRVAAVAITFEGGAVANHANRAQLARQVLTAPIPALTYALAVATDPTIVDAASATDVQISNAVSGQWNAWAGGL